MSQRISMRFLIREIPAALIRFSGLSWLVRTLVARNRATIVLYHDPDPKTFERHVEYLAARFQFISLDALVDAIHSRDWSCIPRNALVFTFDDGHRRNFELLPTFRKFGIRPTIYAVSSVVGTRRHFWFRHLGSQCYPLIPMQNQDRIATLRRDFDFELTHEFPEDERHVLNSSELLDMVDVVDFGAHTCFHPILTTCDDDECEREIRESRTQIETKTGRSCPHFSYPNGDFGPRELDFARRAGYRSARTVDVGWNDVNTDPFRLRITGITDDASLNVVAAQLSGITMFLRYFLAGSLTGRHRTIYPSKKKA